jgi:hypothetical protein
MLHITKFYKDNCLGCDKLNKELELLQLNQRFSTPFALHSVNVDDHPEFKLSYRLRKVPHLIFEDIPDFHTDYQPHPNNTLSTIIGQLEGYHKQLDIIHAIDFSYSLLKMKN